MYLQNPNIIKGKKIVKYIISLYFINMMIFMSKVVKKNGFDFNMSTYTLAIVILLVTYYRGNKISKWFININIVVTIAMLYIWLFIMISNLNILNKWAMILVGILIICSLFIMRKFIILKKLDKYYLDFMEYQYNKKSRKVRLIENITVIIGIIYLKYS